MLRDEKLLALDEVTQGSQLVLDHLQQFADALDNPAISRLFLELAEQHRDYVARLDYQVRCLGELPSRADSDREFVEYLASLFHGTIIEDREEVFLDKAINLEKTVREKIDSGLAIELPDDVRSLFTHMRSEIDQSLSRLQAYHDQKT